MMNTWMWWEQMVNLTDYEANEQTKNTWNSLTTMLSWDNVVYIFQQTVWPK